ncbi:DoxX family protein [Orbaceae bacterium ESL0727]|nr:DoxX family protein [Orbaceae bacterium ESL0727]
MSSLLQLIFKLIQSSWLYFLAQILVTSSMWRSGFTKLINFNAAVEEMAESGLSPAFFFAALVIFVQLAGTFLVIFGRRWAWLGAGALGVFTIMTIFVIHHFWTYTGVQYDVHLTACLNHLTLIGGLILSAIASVLRYHSDSLVTVTKK